MQKIKSGDVSKLMQHLYFRHQLGLEKLENNVFEVLLPPPTEEEPKEAIEHQRNDTAISLEERLNIAVWRLGGWQENYRINND